MKPGNPNFKKGISGNPNGRPKGSVNKDRKKLLGWINKYLDNPETTDIIQSSLKKLSPRDYIAAITKLMEFSIPKQRHQINEYEGEQIDWNVTVKSEDSPYSSNGDS